MLEVSLRNMHLMKRQENDVLLQPLLNTYLVKNLKMTYLKCLRYHQQVELRVQNTFKAYTTHF